MERRENFRVVIKDKRSLEMEVCNAAGKSMTLLGWVADISASGIKMYFSSKLPSAITKDIQINCDFKADLGIVGCTINTDIVWLKYVDELDVTYIGGEFVNPSISAVKAIDDFISSP